MQARGANAHQELTDPENELYLGTLTQKAWKMLNVKSMRVAWYSNYEGHPLGNQTPNVGLELFHQALRTSGSIGGAHRRDLKDAIIGAPIQSQGLSVQVEQPKPADPAQQGKPKRGL